MQYNTTQFIQHKIIIAGSVLRNISPNLRNSMLYNTQILLASHYIIFRLVIAEYLTKQLFLYIYDNFFYKILNVLSLNFNFKVRIITSCARIFFGACKHNSKMTVLKKVGQETFRHHARF